MATFMILHGSWHWGGCFMALANSLAIAGHRVITPDLATHGFDETRPGEVADMQQYTATAREALMKLDEPAILVGHSIAGATCTYLGEQLPDRISKLVYLTAFMCPNGTCPNDYIFSQPYLEDPMAADLFQILSADPLGVRLDLSDRRKVKTAFYGDCSDHAVEVASRCVIPVTPNLPYLAPTDTTSERFGRLPRIYIECTNDQAIPLSIQRKMQADVPGARRLTIESSHSPFFSQPEALANMLAALAEE